MQPALVRPDGTHELFGLGHQNAHGDRRDSSLDSIDPTASAVFVDQTLEREERRGIEAEHRDRLLPQGSPRTARGADSPDGEKERA